MLVEASEVSFGSNEQDLCTPKDAIEVDWLHNFFWQNEVDNPNEILLEVANVTYFDNVILAAVFVGEENAQVAKFFCWLIMKDRNKIRKIFLKTICLFLTILIDVCLP